MNNKNVVGPGNNASPSHLSFFRNGGAWKVAAVAIPLLLLVGGGYALYHFSGAWISSRALCGAVASGSVVYSISLIALANFLFQKGQQALPAAQTATGQGGADQTSKTASGQEGESQVALAAATTSAPGQVDKRPFQGQWHRIQDLKPDFPVISKNGQLPDSLNDPLLVQQPPKSPILSQQPPKDGKQEMPFAEIPTPKAAAAGAAPLYNETDDRETQLTKIIDELKKHKNDLTKTIETLKRIPESFFAEKSHERAKAVFSRVMQEVLGSEVSFPKAERVEPKEGLLNPEVFRYSVTNGVQGDIPRSSSDEEHLHIYQVASQYNAAEALDAFTPKVGTAIANSAQDKTQGPLAQRTNPIIFEYVTAFLTNLGFNMLEEALPSAGKTYEKNAPNQHGYLRPKAENIERLANELTENYQEAEYVCYSSFPDDWEDKKNPVYLMLQAGPAIGYSEIAWLHHTADNLLKPEMLAIKNHSHALQKYAALANFTAIFRQGIELAKKGNFVVIHLTAVGGGVYGNESDNIQWGLQQAALEMQDELKEHGVKVQLEPYAHETSRLKKSSEDAPQKETYHYDDLPLAVIGKNLGLNKGPRIGD